MNTPEKKKMIGERRKNSDGFTYVYGAVKDGSKVNHSSNRLGVKKAIRSHKRGVRAKELRRQLKEQE